MSEARPRASGATRWLIRRHVRRRWPALAAVALIVAAGASGTFVTAGAADRTAGAYDRYLVRAHVSDLAINPALSTAQIEREIRDLPGVRSVTSEGFFLASFDDDGQPRTVREGQADVDEPQVRGSTDGRYHTMDRPALVAGRLPTGHDEAMVSRGLAEAQGIELGDVYSVSFWGRHEGSSVHPDFAEPDTVVSPLGVERLQIVGIGTLSDEVLPEGLFPRDRVVVSPDVVERYDCRVDVPARDSTLEEALLAFTPAGCATSYRYYSLDIDGGPAQVAAVAEEFRRRAAELNPTLPTSFRQAGYQYYLIATTTAQEQARVERSTQPTVAALTVLAGLAAAVTAVVAGLAVARELRRSDAELVQWRQLGLTTAERVRALAVPLAAAVVAGLVVAVAAAWLLSPIGPVGSVRSVEPSPRRELSGWVAPGAAGFLVVLVAAVVALAHRAARHAARAVPGPIGSGAPRPPALAGIRGRAPSTLRRLVGSAAGRPEVAEGVRAAQTGYRGAGLVVASGGVAAGAFLAAVVFGASLSSVVSTPAAYGWPWDVAVMTDFGYGGLDLPQAIATLERRDDVERWTALGFTNQIAVAGEPVLAVLGYDRSSAVDFPVVEGRLPTDAGEAALGARTAADLGLEVGDEVELSGDALPEPREVTITGLAVLPPLGPYQSDRAAPGSGLLLPEATFPEEFLADTATFLGIDLAPGADAAAVRAELDDDFLAWDAGGLGVLGYDAPVRPAEIDDADRMLAVPLLVGGLLVVAAVVGLALAVVMSVRGRRRELAVLRALGFTGRQLRTSVRVQALVTMAVALVVGVPVGVALGRLAWRAFAGQLGVAAGPVVPLGWVAVTVAGALVVALVAAAVPARAAARIDPATTLRSE